MIFATDLPGDVGSRQSVCLASEQLNFAQDYQSYDGLLVTACWDDAVEPIPNLLDPDRRDPDLCTAVWFPEGIPISGARLPVEYPVCP